MPPVRAQLTIASHAATFEHVGTEPALDARVTVRTFEPHGDEPRRVLMAIVLESGTTWQLAIEPALAAYLSGALAQEAGVVFG